MWVVVAILSDIFSTFYLHEAVLARVLAMALCLYVSVTDWAEQIRLVLAQEFHSIYPTPCYKEIGIPFKNKGTSLWNFAPNSGLRKFRHDESIVEMCYQLSSRKVDAQTMIN